MNWAMCKQKGLVCFGLRNDFHSDEIFVNKMTVSPL